jgi:UDP-N-acetylmuramoyl-L-alanyl-D-glutamate--2,6-diaminopimelate ligase
VFGCGGNRDAGKRPLMGAIAQRLSQQVVITSDNPRDEPPGAILVAIAAGLSAGAPLQVIEDRGAAIAHAVSQAGPNDVVLIAGKGHEAYQEIAGVRHPFDDVIAARAALHARAGAAEASS